jgi:hypothetical protein
MKRCILNFANRAAKKRREQMIAMFAAALLTPLTPIRAARAHDPHEVIYLKTTENEKVINAMIAKVPIALTTRIALESLLRRDHIWNNPRLTVCFGPSDAVDARRDLIERVMAVANEWTAGTRLALDFGAPTPRKCVDAGSASIRVNIADLGRGKAQFASLVGNDAAYASIERYEPHSMLLLFPQNDSYYNNEQVFRFYVLHEFGHALGAEHEHQRIDCGYSYSYIAAHFNFSSAKDAQDNLSQMFAASQSAYPGINVKSLTVESSYDNYSVMKYNLSTLAYPSGDDPNVYLEGTKSKCYRSGWVSKLTEYEAQIRRGRAFLSRQSWQSAAVCWLVG